MHRTSPRVLLSLTAAGALAVAVLPGAAAHASFPGGNGVIAWSHPVSLTTDSEIFAINPDGSGSKTLTDNDRNDSFPAWSPDGRSLAYESSTATDVDIYVLDKTGERDLTNDPVHADRFPAWSPDGRWIAYSQQTPFSADGALWVTRSDGSGRAHQITTADSVNSEPAWAPDGRTILFTGDRGGSHDLWSVRPDGRNLRQVTRTPTVQEGNPNWRPDGGRIAYDVCLSASFPCPGSPNYEIVSAAPDGSDVRRLTAVDGIDANPAWSPDGSQLVFRSDRTGFTQLWRIDADGANPTQLTFRNFTGGVDPDWQPVP